MRTLMLFYIVLITSIAEGIWAAPLQAQDGASSVVSSKGKRNTALCYVVTSDGEVMNLDHICGDNSESENRGKHRAEIDVEQYWDAEGNPISPPPLDSNGGPISSPFGEEAQGEFQIPRDSHNNPIAPPMERAPLQ